MGKDAVNDLIDQYQISMPSGTPLITMASCPHWRYTMVWKVEAGNKTPKPQHVSGQRWESRIMIDLWR